MGDIYQAGSWVFSFRGIERCGYFHILDFFTSEEKMLELPKVDFICAGQ